MTWIWFWCFENGQFGYRTGRNEARPTKNRLVFSWIFNVQPVFGGIIPIDKFALCRRAETSNRPEEKIWENSQRINKMIQSISVAHIACEYASRLGCGLSPLNSNITLVGGLEHEFYSSIQLGMSSSQLTLIFFRGVGSTTNQIITGWWPETTPIAVKSQDGPQSSLRSVAEEEVAKKRWFLWFMVDSDITIVNGLYKPTYSWRAPSNGWCQPMRFAASNPTFDA